LTRPRDRRCDLGAPGDAEESRRHPPQYTHFTHDRPDEPPVALPIAVLLASAYTLWRGAGRWSMDLGAARVGRAGRAPSTGARSRLMAETRG
jgi:hypothetical protein